VKHELDQKKPEKWDKAKQSTGEGRGEKAGNQEEGKYFVLLSEFF